MLIEKLFSAGIMEMGPSRVDPDRQVGVFNPEFVSSLPAFRASEMERVHWLAGDWNHENVVPATRLSPAYADIGTSSFSMSEDGSCLCVRGSDGREIPNITFDPFSRQWIYMLLRGAYGMLRSEFVTFLTSVVVCGRKAPKSIYQQASPGSFDFAP